MGLGIQMIIDMGVDGDHVGIVDGDSASGTTAYSSSGKLFISKFCVHISASIQLIIFPSRHTANTRLFRLTSLNCYMAPSNVLPPSSQVTRSLWQTTQETPLPANTLPRLGKVSPHALSNSSIDDVAQMHHPQPFDLPGSLNCSFMRGSTNRPS